MEIGFYFILFLLILFKLLIWVCVIFCPARKRQIITQRGLIIAEGDITARPTRDRDMIITREHQEHQPGLSQVGVDNPTVVTNPPSYEEVQRTKCNKEKPPSYDQIVGGNVFLPTITSVSERPPEYSPVAPQLHQTSLHSQQTTTDSVQTTSNSNA